VSAEILAGINALPGVVGSALIGAQNRCVAFAMPPPYEPMLLCEVVGLLREAFDPLSSLEDEPRPQQFFLHFEESSLVVRWAGEFTFVVVTTPERSGALLSVALGAAGLKLANANANTGAGASVEYAGTPSVPIYEPLAPPSPSTPPPSGATFRTGFGSGPGRDAWTARTPVSTPDLAEPASVLSPPSTPALAARPRPSQPEVVDPRAIDQMTEALAQHIGPIAKSLVKRELVKMGAVPDALGRKAYFDLVMTLARNIKEPSLAGSFSATALRFVGP
jgi:hypothetical protein